MVAFALQMFQPSQSCVPLQASVLNSPGDQQGLSGLAGQTVLWAVEIVQFKASRSFFAHIHGVSPTLLWLKYSAKSQRDPREISGSLFLSKLSSLELCPTTGSIFCFPEIRALSSRLGDSCSACDPSPRPFSLHCGPEGASKQKDTAVVGVTSLVLFPSLRDHTLALLLVQGLKPSVPHITFLVVYDTGDPVSP